MFTKALTRTKQPTGPTEREARPIFLPFWIDFEILSRGIACEDNVTKAEERLRPLLGPRTMRLRQSFFKTAFLVLWIGYLMLNNRDRRL